jgi:hypothetical protein
MISSLTVPRAIFAISLFVVIVGGTAVALHKQAVPGVYTGWCCIAQGVSCRQAVDAPSCGNGGGIAFSVDHSSCNIACGTDSRTFSFHSNAR